MSNVYHLDKYRRNKATEMGEYCIECEHCNTSNDIKEACAMNIGRYEAIGVVCSSCNIPIYVSLF